MPCSATSDLGLHCLSMSHKNDARLILFKGLVKIEYHGQTANLGGHLPD